MPVEPVVKSASDVTTSQKTFFDPGATSSSLASEKTGSCLVQAAGSAVTVDEMQTATQPVQAPGAGTAT